MAFFQKNDVYLILHHSKKIIHIKNILITKEYSLSQTKHTLYILLFYGSLLVYYIVFISLLFSMNRVLSTAMQIEQSKVYKSFFANHNLVLSFALTHSHFLEYHQTTHPCNGTTTYVSLSAPPIKKVYVWVASFEKIRQMDSIDNMIIQYFLWNNWYLKKTFASALWATQQVTHADISLFIEWDYYLSSTYSNLILEYIYRVIKHNHNISKTLPLELDSILTHSFLTYLSRNHPELLSKVHSILKHHDTLLSAYNTTSTTIERLKRPSWLWYIVTSNPYWTWSQPYASTQLIDSITAWVYELIQWSKKYQNNILKEKMQHIRHQIITQLDKTPELISLIYNREKHLETHLSNDTYVIIIPNWNYLYWYCLANDQEMLQTKMHAIKMYIQSHWTQLSIIHNSITQGTWSPWIECLQRISQWVIHQYSPVQTILKTTHKQIVYLDPEELNSKQWIILNATTNKVTIHWNKFTSDDLPSQKSVVEIFGALILNYWEQLHNSQLPVSSYSKNKNNLVWKVIAPFQKVVSKILWKKIHIETVWWLYDFSVMLPKQHLSIIFIQNNDTNTWV